MDKSFSDTSNSLNVGKEDLALIALEVWKLESAIKKSETNLSDVEKERLFQRVTRLNSLLERVNIEVKDFTGKAYNSGISALEVVDTVEDSESDKALVKETVSPAVYIEGELFKRSKIIISTPK